MKHHIKNVMLDSLKYNNITYAFQFPIEFRVEYLDDDCVMITSLILNENIWDENEKAAWDTMAEAVHKIYEDYVLADDNELCDSAIEYKKSMDILIRREES